MPNLLVCTHSLTHTYMHMYPCTGALIAFLECVIIHEYTQLDLNSRQELQGSEVKSR